MRKLLFLFALLTGCAHTSGSRFVNGLHVDDGGRGSGTPVLFVHGNGANLTQWRYQLDHVRQSRRAAAFDLRGMGQSQPAANGDYSVNAMADDVETVARALKLSRFVIAGHSYGCAVVAAYAAKHPDRVAGVVFADGAGNVKMTDEAVERFLTALRADKTKLVRQWFTPILVNASDAVKAEVFASVDRTPVEAFGGALIGMREFDVLAAINSYDGPVLAIASTAIENPASLHKQLQSIRVVKMEGVSHWVMLDKPDEFNAILDRFLAEVDASDSRH